MTAQYDPLEWITLRRRLDSSVEADTSSLLVRSGELRVVGVLPHNATIQPKTVDDATRLIEWLTDWIDTEATMDEPN
jgi:hypothetical protein